MVQCQGEWPTVGDPLGVLVKDASTIYSTTTYEVKYLPTKQTELL